MNKLLLTIAVLSSTLTLHAQTNPYPIRSIDSIQFVNQTKLSDPTANTLPDYITPSFKDSVFRDTVRFEGIVATNPRIYGLSTNRKAAYIQRKGGGPWSGALVMCDAGSGAALPGLLSQTKFYDNFVVGFPVRVTGVIRDFQGETQINLIPNTVDNDNSIEQLGLVKDTLVYTEISARDLMTGNPNTGWVQQKQTAEQWEGTLVEIKNVSVYSIQTSGNRSFWSVIDDFGNVLDVRDMSAYFRRDDNEDTVPKIANTFQPPAIGTRLEFIRGIVTEYAASGVQRYGIIPIYPQDVKVCTTCPPTIKFVNRNPVIAKVNDTINVTVEITVGDTSLRSQMLYFRLPGNTNLDSVAMTPVPSFPNYFVGRIAPLTTEGVVAFWVRAEDRKDRQSFFPDPLRDGRTTYVTTSGVNSIPVIQFSNTVSGSTIWDGDSLLNIDVRGIVTGRGFVAGGTNLISVQNGTGPNSAVFVQRNGPVTDSWNVGDSVQITRATVRENFGVTTLYSVLANVISSGNALPPFATDLSIDSFALNRVAYARPYEAVLVRFDSVKVANTDPDPGLPTNSGEFTFNKTGTGLGLRVDDMDSRLRNLYSKLKPGMSMSFIQGPMYYSFVNFKLIPRGLSDIDLSNLDTLAPVITLNGNNPDTIFKNQSYVDAGATAIDDKDGDISANIIKTGSVDTATAGTYTLWYKATDAWGNSDSVSRTVVVFDTTAVGLRHNELTYAQFNVYPNPANLTVTLSADFIQTVPVTVAIVDVVGKTHVTRTYSDKKFVDHISVADMPNGVYFINVSNNNGTRTFKLMVNH